MHKGQNRSVLCNNYNVATHLLCLLLSLDRSSMHPCMQLTVWNTVFPQKCCRNNLTVRLPLICFWSLQKLMFLICKTNLFCDRKITFPTFWEALLYYRIQSRKHMQLLEPQLLRNNTVSYVALKTVAYSKKNKIGWNDDVNLKTVNEPTSTASFFLNVLLSIFLFCLFIYWFFY